MPAAGLHFVPWLMILWGVFAPLIAAAQGAQSGVPKNPADFQKLVLERAIPDSLATDYGGAWANIYQYLVPARFIDRNLYEQALLQLAATVGHGCDAAKGRQAALACEANMAADVALSLIGFTENVLFRRDAVSFAESIADADPEPLINSLLRLADDEWSHGSITEAKIALNRAAALLAARPGSATHDRRLRVAVLKARLADAHLDDGTALAAFSEAVDAVLSKDIQKAMADPMSDLVTLHLRGRFCPNCGRPIAEPVKRWLTAAGSPLQVLSAPPGTYSASELQTYARRFLRESKIVAMRRQHLAGKDDVAAARTWALASFIGASPFGPPPMLKFLLESNPRRQAAMPMKQVFDDIANDEFGQHGLERSIPAAFEEASWYYENAGFANAARMTLEYLAQYRARYEDEKQAVKRTIRQARVFALALARLAALQLAAGDGTAAARSLEDAGAIAQAKLREESGLDGERAILAMRDLSDTLRLIAQTRHKLVAPTGQAENPAGADALFRAMQAAITGETALTLEIAQQRRILNTPRLAELRREQLRATAEASRMAQIVEQYADFNYDEVLTLARRSAEARRDQVVAELARTMPPAAQAAAEMEPVALADARSHLVRGEALVLLSVGSRSLDGFLLDREGRTFAWRSPVRQTELEALVRSLRTGADMVNGKAPTFPIADAARLHEIIFGPIKGRLGAYRKLLVLGDGPLQSLPYGILLTGMPADEPKLAQQFRAAALPWLVRTHAIALVPSVRSLVAQRSGKHASRAPRPFLGIGNPQLASAGVGQRNIDMKSVFAGSKGGLADIAVLRNLATLPETEDELRDIAKVLNAGPEDIIVGPAANETAVKTLPLTRYRIITFATHGALAGELAGTSEPGLVLTPPPAATAEDDGFLSLSEIADLKLDADLIILSACNTGTSDGRPRAESLSGLARGFFNAGARGLLVTHWAIPSDSAVKSTTGLVAARARDPVMDWADALREATLAIIDREGPPEWAHPSYWGAYVAIGVLPAALDVIESTDAQQSNQRSPKSETTAASTSERPMAVEYLVREQIAAACNGKKGTIDPASVIERDLTGDDKPDLIIHHHGIACEDGGRSGFCGAQECSANLYVRRDKLLRAASEFGAVEWIKVGEGRVPTIHTVTHGGKPLALKWNGSEFRAVSAALPSPAAARSRAAEHLIAEQIAAACDGKPGAIDPRAVIERDLTGDGNADLIISHDGITCSRGRRSGFCGMQVCSVMIYVRHGPLLQRAVGEFLGTKLTVGDGKVPTIRLHAHGGKQHSMKWNGQDFR
jgi:CHAT domain-containing protein